MSALARVLEPQAAQLPTMPPAPPPFRSHSRPSTAHRCSLPYFAQHLHAVASCPISSRQPTPARLPDTPEARRTLELEQDRMILPQRALKVPVLEELVRAQAVLEGVFERGLVGREGSARRRVCGGQERTSKSSLVRVDILAG